MWADKDLQGIHYAKRIHHQTSPLWSSISGVVKVWSLSVRSGSGLYDGRQLKNRCTHHTTCTKFPSTKNFPCWRELSNLTDLRGGGGAAWHNSAMNAELWSFNWLDWVVRQWWVMIAVQSFSQSRGFYCSFSFQVYRLCPYQRWTLFCLK